MDQRREGVSPRVSAGGQLEELLWEPVLAPMTSLTSGFPQGLAACQHPPIPFILSTNALLCIVFSNLLWNIFREMKRNSAGKG